MLLLFSIGAILFFLSINKKKYIGIIDFGFLLSSFFIFYRPIFLNYCDNFINKKIYLWDNGDYIYGTVFSAIAIILFYLSYNSSIKRVKITDSFSLIALRENPQLLAWFVKVNRIIVLLYLALMVFVYGFIGASWGSGEQLSGAMSVRIPGFEFVWPFINFFLFLGVFLSVILLYIKRRRIYLLQFLIIVGVALLLGRRGALVSPILLSIFVVSIGRVRISWRAIRHFKGRGLLFIGLLGFILFFGKGLTNYLFETRAVNYAATEDDTPFACVIVKKGHQEFDLFWPAVIAESSLKNIAAIPGALLGNFISHQERLDNFENFYSSTDHLMMKYNGGAYRDLKFGISPNFHQYYYYYFGILSVLIIIFLGKIGFIFEKRIIACVRSAQIFKMYFLYIFWILLNSPWDTTLKYFLFNSFILFVFSWFVKIVVGKPKLNNCHH